jgi:hypothetical protein
MKAEGGRMKVRLSRMCLHFILPPSSLLFEPGHALKPCGSLLCVTSGLCSLVIIFFLGVLSALRIKDMFPTPADPTSLLEPEVEDGRQLTYSRAAERPNFGRRPNE